MNKSTSMTAITDSELLGLYAGEASAPAFEELVRRHLNHVFSAAMRRVNGDRALAEDVTQTVFVDFARKASRIPADMPPGGWLHRHTGFVASKMIDKERRRRSREQEAAIMNATELSTANSPQPTLQNGRRPPRCSTRQWTRCPVQIAMRSCCASLKTAISVRSARRWG